VRNQDAASIGPSTHISGDIRANEDLTVHGHFEGSIHLRLRAGSRQHQRPAHRPGLRMQIQWRHRYGCRERLCTGNR
jgi:hypothetical protein